MRGGGYYQNRNHSHFNASKVKMTLNKKVSAIPELASLIRVDHLSLDFTLLTKFEISIIFLWRIVFANYYYDVIHIFTFIIWYIYYNLSSLLSKFQYFCWRKKENLACVMEKAKNIWTTTCIEFWRHSILELYLASKMCLWKLPSICFRGI